MRLRTILVVMMIAAACGDAEQDPGAIEPPVSTAICCSTQDGCYHGVESEGDCELLAGTLGAPGAVCDGATGTCLPPPARPGQCCHVPEVGVCLTGPSLNLPACVRAGGTEFPSGATCRPDTTCALVGP